MAHVEKPNCCTLWNQQFLKLRGPMIELFAAAAHLLAAWLFAKPPLLRQASFSPLRGDRCKAGNLIWWFQSSQHETLWSRYLIMWEKRLGSRKIARPCGSTSGFPPGRFHDQNVCARNAVLLLGFGKSKVLTRRLPMIYHGTLNPHRLSGSMAATRGAPLIQIRIRNWWPLSPV